MTLEAPTARTRPRARPRMYGTAALTSMIVCCALLSLASTSFEAPALAADSFSDRVDVKGYLQESIAGRRGQIDDVIFHRQTFNTEVEVEASDMLHLRFAVDLWRDDPDFLGRDTFRSRVREAYAKLAFEDFDLRIGRFQVAWGQSDALVIADQITPFDLTNFIVPDFDEIRMGVDGTLLDYYFDNGNEVEFVWLTRFTQPDFPDFNSPWAFIDLKQVEDAGLTLLNPAKPAWKFSNSEYGVRYQGHPSALDWSIGYFRSFDDRPAPRVLPPYVIPTHDQFNLFMADLAYPIGNYLIRAETAYENGRFLSTFDAADPLRADARSTAAAGFVTKQDVSRTLVGIDTKPDVPGWRQADLTLQFVHEQVVNPHPALASSSHNEYLVMIASAAYRNETIKPRLLSVVNAIGSDAWVQARVDYEPIDNWRFSFEYDQFFGHGFNGSSGGLFGFFDRNDFFLLTVRRSY